MAPGTAPGRLFLFVCIWGAALFGVGGLLFIVWSHWLLERGSFLAQVSDAYVDFFAKLPVAVVAGAGFGLLMFLATEFSKTRARLEPPNLRRLAFIAVPIALFVGFAAGFLVHRYSAGPAERWLTRQAAASYQHTNVILLANRADISTAIRALDSYISYLRRLDLDSPPFSTLEDQGLALARVSELERKSGRPREAAQSFSVAQHVLQQAAWRNVSAERITTVLRREDESANP